MTPYDIDVADRGELSVRPSPPEIDTALTTLADLRRALTAADRVLVTNEPHKRGRWRRETVFSHVAHALAHLECWRDGRRTEDLEHALVRGLMALELALAEGAESSTKRNRTEDRERC